MPPLKIPKKIRKIQQWNTGAVVDGFNNLSQLVNRYIHPTNKDASLDNKRKSTCNDINMYSSQPQGISTISGHIIFDSEITPESPQRSNFGLYALKHDRNAAKKGILLHIPTKINTGKTKIKLTKAKTEMIAGSSSTLRKEATHEKFSPCRNRLEQGESLDESVGGINDCFEEILQIEIESDMENDCNINIKPVVPPRRRRKPSMLKKEAPKRIPLPESKSEQSIHPVKMHDFSKTQTQEKPEPKSLAAFIVNNKPEMVARPKPNLIKEKTFSDSRQDSINIFEKEDDDVFHEFDKIFKNNKTVLSSGPRDWQKKSFSESRSSERKNIETKKNKISSVKITKAAVFTSSSFSASSLDEPVDLPRRKIDRRPSTSITVQDFRAKSFPRCKSIVSPTHNDDSLPLEDSVGNIPGKKEIDSVTSSYELQSPGIVSSTIKKVPQSILKLKSIPTQTSIASINHESPVKKDLSQNCRKFFVYYNDEDELVFNQKYITNNDEEDIKSKTNSNKKQFTTHQIPIKIPLTNEQDNNNFTTNNINSHSNLQEQPLSIYTISSQNNKKCSTNNDDHSSFSGISFGTSHKNFNHPDAIYKNYYAEENNSLNSSMASSNDGIFI